MDFFQRALELQEYTVNMRRYLHMHPEVSGEEVETARTISKQLDQFGVSNEVLPCNAVIARIHGAHGEKCVALRADIDAIMCEDMCNKPYRSQNPGMCHACGHDAHTAALLCASRMLNEVKHSLPGDVLIIFQPSEERPPSGAQRLIEEYDILHGVDGIFGIHVVNRLDAGDVSVQAGPRLAGSMNFYVDIHGKGGHGAMPEECKDPIVAACATVMNLQSIVSRETSPLDSVSLTVGIISGGASHHSVAESAHFEAAIKSLNADIRDRIKKSVERIVLGTAEIYRCSADIRFTNFGMPLINDERLSEIAERSAAAQLGAEHVVKCAPWPVSEDFTKYTQLVPGVFALVGGRNVEKGLTLQNHHPQFDIDESALSSAAAVYAGFAFDFLSE